jgi:sugar transferase (PEP-CTERM/EpsH1 system associated)
MTALQGMRILVMTPSVPYPPMWGFNIRVFNILRRLSARNRVSLLCYQGAEPDTQALQTLGEICEHIFTVPDVERSIAERRLLQARAVLSPGSFHLRRYVSAPMQARLTQVLAEDRYDLVQVESSAMAGFDFGNTPVILDEHNLEYELLRRSNAVESSRIRRAFAANECRKVEREEMATWQNVRGCVLTSEREQAIVNRASPDVPTAVVPNGVSLDYFQPAASPITPGSMVFTGLMTYRPNADGVSFFIRRILPAIRAARGDAAFTAVGWGLPDDIRPLLGDGISHTGRVEDIRPYLAQAAVVVVPLRIGSGTRLKVLEALAMAKPVVSTSVGCEGLDVTHGEHLLIADDPATFAASVLRLLEDPDEAASLGRRGRALVESRYGWEQSVAELERFHQSLFDRGPDLAQPAVGAANR